MYLYAVLFGIAAVVVAESGSVPVVVMFWGAVGIYGLAATVVGWRRTGWVYPAVGTLAVPVICGYHVWLALRYGITSPAESPVLMLAFPWLLIGGFALAWLQKRADPEGVEEVYACARQASFLEFITLQCIPDLRAR